MSYIKVSLRRLQHVLNLRKGEKHTVSLLLAFSFLQYFSLAVLFVTASAIFLTDHSIQELPYVFIGTSASLFVLAIIFDQLEKVLSPRSIILSEAIMIFLVVVLFRYGFNYDLGWIGYGIIIWHRVMSDYVGDGFNRLVLMLLDVRQSKRLYGLVSSSEIPANILGYLAATLLIPFTGTENLLWVSAAGLLLSLVFLFVIVFGKHKEAINKFGEMEDQIESNPAVSREPESLFKKIFKTKFIFLLSMTISVSVISIIFIEFAFLNKVAAETENQQDIVRFIAIVFGAGQFIAFFIKTFLYGFIHRNYGMKLALFVLPVTLAIICVFVIVESFLPDSTSLLIYTWIFIMLITDILESSVYRTSFISLLQPLDRKMKMEGYKIMNNIEIIAIGLGGLILVLTYSEDNDNLLHYSYLLLAGASLWIFCIPHLNKSYLKTLSNVLRKRFIESSALEINTPQTLQIIQEKLNSRHPGEVIYALDVLSKDENINSRELLANLLSHQVPEVRKEVYTRIVSMKVEGLREEVKERIAADPDSSIKKLAVQTYCFLGDVNITDEIIPMLDDPDTEIQAGALVGLISYGGINGIIAGGQRLLEFINSPDPELRKFGAYVIGEVGIHNFYRPILTLLADPDLEVRKASLLAAGKVKHPKLHEPLVQAVYVPKLFESAMNALINCGEMIVPAIEQEMKKDDIEPRNMRRLVAICGRVGGENAIRLLKGKFYYQNIEVRDQVLHSCSVMGYVPTDKEKEYILTTFHEEMADATWFLNCINVLLHTNKWMQQSNFDLLIRALYIELKHISKRVLYLLSFLYESREMVQVWQRIQMNDRTKKANALEIVDMMVSKDLAVVILPLLENYPISQQLKILNNKYPMPELSLDEFLQKLITGEECPCIIPWTKAEAIYAVQHVRMPALLNTLENMLDHKESLFAETAAFTLRKIKQMDHGDDAIADTIVMPKGNKAQVDMETKLLTIEKVMALKTTAIFRETAEDLLVDIASILKEISYKKDDIIVQKDEIGTCMYIIYSGSVLIHDGTSKLAELKDGNFFGELALLDTEPRSASVTALEDSLLLRIDQEAFYEIMADRSEVIREIMKILCQRLRNQNEEVTRLRAQLHT